MLTPENADLIKQSIFTLIFTLKNIEVCPCYLTLHLAVSVSRNERHGLTVVKC